MSDLFKVLSELVRDLLKQRLPAVYRLTLAGIDTSYLATSWSGRLVRILGGRAVAAVGAVATVVAITLFAIDALGPADPSAGHDTIIRNRLSSPAPSPNILIVDIDERSLALLAPEFGRWPWPRNVLADGLQKIADLGAKAIVFNVLISDPDKARPDADAAMEATAAMVRNVAFPMTRLNPNNDSISQLKIANIEGAQELPPAGKTLAALLPLTTTMHDRLGISNPKTGADGIVRSASLVWAEPGFRIPTIVGRALEVGEANVRDIPEQLSLNWRNKQGSYQRISFGDLLQAKDGDLPLKQISGAWVVIGASAPGIGQTIPTPSKPITDANEILATAIDDAITKTWLRLMPSWLTLFIDIFAIWGLIAFSLGKINRSLITKVFVIAQSTFGAITLLSVSYTNYLIDLSQSMSFGLAVFSVIKIIQGLEVGWLRAQKGMRRIDAKITYQGDLTLVCFSNKEVDEQDRINLVKSIEKIVGVSRVIHVDDLIGGNSFLSICCADLEFLLVLGDESHEIKIEEVLAAVNYKNKIVVTHHKIAANWKTDEPSLANELGPIILESAAKLIRIKSD